MTMFDYRFYVNDYNRISNHKGKFPKAELIFNYPIAAWFGCKNGKRIKNLYHRVDRLLNRASPRIPVLVIYNIPDRDVGQHSAGGAKTRQDYLDWIKIFAKAVGTRKPIIIFEPDALPHYTELSKDKQEERLSLVKSAVDILTEYSCAYVYVDIGHSNWLSPEQAGLLLNSVTNENVRGFSVNVSNYRTTKESVNWASQVAEYANNKYFVVDTSRNGNGPYGNDWCNPPNRALGHPPTVYTRHELCDAYLWVKVPGESDGNCNGGPNAGTFWLEQARELVDNTQWLDQ